MLGRVLIGFVAVFIFVCTAAAGPFEDGIAAYKAGDFATALRLWQPLADQGDPRAQNNLGVLYEDGSGVASDLTVAAEWYRKAAAQGHVGARKNLADLRARLAPAQEPQGSQPKAASSRPDQDLVLSGDNWWVALASRREITEAIAVAGGYSEKNVRVVRARNGWYAVIMGPVVTRDIWSFRASYAGPALPSDAMLTRGAGYIETVWRPGSAGVLAGTFDEGRQAYKRGDYAAATRIWRQLAEDGNPSAQNYLGLMFETGIGVPVDYVEAVKWYQRSAAQGDAAGQANLADMYEHGKGVPKDEAAARYLYTLSLAQSDAPTWAKEIFPQFEKHYVSALATEGVCRLALNFPQQNDWDLGASSAAYIAEAKRRNLSADDCRVVLGLPSAELPNTSAEVVCSRALNQEKTDWDVGVSLQVYVVESKRRNLSIEDCRAAIGLPRYVLTGVQVQTICSSALNRTKDNWERRESWAAYVYEAKRRNLSVDGCREILGLPPLTPAALPPGQEPATVGGSGVTIGIQTVADRTFITVEGDLKSGDEKRFADAAIRAGDAVVLFNSWGGNLIAGIEIGRAIRLKGFSTLVLNGYTCASACGLAWLGGRQRLMEHDAKIGFHAAFFDEPNQSVTSGGNALVGAYLNQLGLSAEAIVYLTDKKPSEMQWLTIEDAARIGIEVREFKSE